MARAEVAVKNLIEASANFNNTYQYKFQLVAKAHLVMVMDMLKSY